MNGKNRRRIEMGGRALEISTTHPHDSPGYTGAVEHLEQSVAAGAQAALDERAAHAEVRAASARKREIRRRLKRANLSHVIEVGKAAAVDAPGLAERFTLKPGITTYMAFRTAARGIATAAQEQKALLVKYGLVEAVLDDLVAALDEFDAAVQRSAEGRRAHVGARARIEEIGKEIVQVVRVLDGVNRFRFAGNPELLAAWGSASNVQATPRGPAEKPAPGGTPPPSGGEVRPAA